MDAVIPGAALGTLYSSGVGTNKTKQHSKPLSSPKAEGPKFTNLGARRSPTLSLHGPEDEMNTVDLNPSLDGTRVGNTQSRWRNI